MISKEMLEALFEDAKAHTSEFTDRQLDELAFFCTTELEDRQRGIKVSHKEAEK